MQIGKEQITLGRDRAEAWRKYYRIMASRGVEVPKEDVAVAVTIDLYIDATKPKVTPATLSQYKYKLDDFASACGTMMVRALTAVKIAEWVKSHKWSQSTRRQAITYVKLWLEWCVTEGYLDASPAKGIKRPKMGRRERTVSPDERKAVLEAWEAGDVFLDFVKAIGWTGSRPNEIARLEAAHIDWEAAIAVLPGKTTGVTGIKMEIHLIPPMLELCRRLAEKYPTGPLFRNRDGNAWNVNSVRSRMTRMRKRVGGLDGVTAYTYRHSFATDALERGVPLADVSALMNHRDVRTTMGYAHLHQRRTHLRRQAEKATGDPKPDA